MKPIRTMILLTAVLAAPGCTSLLIFGAGTAAGVTGVKYYEGALTVVYEAPFMETWDGAVAALEGLDIRIKGQSHDLTTGKISGERADGTDVTLSFKYRSARRTEVVIRVGIFGDEPVSQKIKEEIRRRLFAV